jgi:hypothetical protein
MDGLEKKLDDLLGSSAPVKLPDNGKRTLADFMPWLALGFGILQLILALGLYNWARATSGLTDYAQSLCQAYSTSADCGIGNRWSVGLYVALAVLALDGLLLLLAFPGLRARRKQGWNLLFYAAILNLVYGVVAAFTDYGSGIMSLFWSLVTSVVGLWLLFQIRPLYTGARVAKKDGTTSPPESPVK